MKNELVSRDNRQFSYFNRFFIIAICYTLAQKLIRKRIITFASTSVTRIGEISPLWKIFLKMANICGLFGFGQSFQLTLAHFHC